MKNTIEVRMKLLGGGEIGTCVVITDLPNIGNKEYIERVLQEMLRKGVDRLILRGAYEISRQNNKEENEK